MKKFLVLFLVFLFSCSNEVLDKETENTNVLFDKNWNVLYNSNSWNDLNSKENIKQICDNLEIWENLENIEKKFWKAILLSETMSEDISYSSYYYWKMWEETCLFILDNWKINTKQYIN